MSAYTVTLTRYWSECITVEVNAQDVNDAREQAIEEVDDIEFDWSRVDNDGTETYMVQDSDGKVLYERDTEDEQADVIHPATIKRNEVQS